MVRRTSALSSINQMSYNADKKLKFFMTFTRLDANLKVVKEIYTVDIPFLNYDRMTMMKQSLSGDYKNVPSPLPNGYKDIEKLFNPPLPSGITYQMARLIESETIHGMKYVFLKNHSSCCEWVIANDKKESVNE